MKENGFTQNSKKQTIPHTNYYGRRLRRWHSTSWNTHTHAKTQLQNHEKVAGVTELHVNAEKNGIHVF